MRARWATAQQYSHDPAEADLNLKALDKDAKLATAQKNDRFRNVTVKVLKSAS